MTTSSQDIGALHSPGGGERLLAEYDREKSTMSPSQALATLEAGLASAPERDWLDCAQRLVLRGLIETATMLLTAARSLHPDCTDITFALAGLYLEQGRPLDAESLFREVLGLDPAHCAAALMLGRVLGEAGRTNAAALVLRAAFLAHHQPIDRLIQSMELLDRFDRKADAFELAEAEIAKGCIDPRIHAYAASYAIQLGEFERARERYLYAYEHSEQAPEWKVPFGLASTQRYQRADHPDFRLLLQCLARPELGEPARISLLFGLGKAFDDVGDVEEAARYFRQANARAAAVCPRSRKQWRRGIAARIQAPPITVRRERTSDFSPIFIVGVPRSGTTLTAELLGRHPQVCNRGELTWMWKLSHRLPPNGQPDRALLDSLAQEYERQVRRDDATGKDVFIDKQPLNLLHVDLILALWPHAKIIYSRRSARDTALSIWMQSFQDDAFVFSFDFADISAFQQGCGKLMEHWLKRYPASIRTLRYEDLTAAPETAVSDVFEWLGLPPFDSIEAFVEDRPQAINTASLWQARQPVYRRSVGRWSRYALLVPELSTFSTS